MLKHATFVLLVATAGTVHAQTVTPGRKTPTAQVSAAAETAGSAAPADYVIGPDDQLSVVFWRDKDMSADVAVRPDGKISLPLLNDIQAAGLTPPQLRDRLTEDARRYIEDPNITVVVRQINSRRVFVTGEVAKPGPYALTGPTTILQILATAGGLKEYADEKNILVLRNEGGRPVSYKFNYRDVAKHKNLSQNVELKPGDTVIVP
jgi:polysaccharide biosynthesis/export protein